MAITDRSKFNSAYVATATAIASEASSTTDHDKRLAIARQLAQGGGSVDWFISNDFNNVQNYTDATPQGTINTRLSALVTVLVSLGF